MGFLDDYEPVEERLRQFWTQNQYGRVLTDLITDPTDNVIIFKASVWRDGAQPSSSPDATGYAHQRILDAPPAGRNGRPNDSAPEWTSPWEVAETSAIGRALANLGYAAKGKRPSREEMSKASAPPSGRAAPSSSLPGSSAAQGTVASPGAHTATVPPTSGTETSGGESLVKAMT